MTVNPGICDKLPYVRGHQHSCGAAKKARKRSGAREEMYIGVFAGALPPP